LLTLDLFLRVVGTTKEGGANVSSTEKKWASWQQSWGDTAAWYVNQHGWDLSSQWEHLRWESSHPWNNFSSIPFSPNFGPPLPSPLMPWPPGALHPGASLGPPHVPPLSGGTPMPSAAFWSSATHGMGFTHVHKDKKIQI